MGDKGIKESWVKCQQAFASKLCGPGINIQEGAHAKLMQAIKELHYCLVESSFRAWPKGRTGMLESVAPSERETQMTISRDRGYVVV